MPTRDARPPERGRYSHSLRLATAGGVDYIRAGAGGESRYRIDAGHGEQEFMRMSSVAITRNEFIEAFANARRASSTRHIHDDYDEGRDAPLGFDVSRLSSIHYYSGTGRATLHFSLTLFSFSYYLLLR